MRVSAEWLGELVGVTEPKRVAEFLEQVGVEIEQLVYTPKLDKKVIVAEVKKVAQHPNADKLKVVELSLGKAKTSVVCGGPNVDVGQRVALVQPGATLPDGTKIDRATIRGVESSGMIASAFELGLGDDKAGIMVLEQTAKIGSPVSDIWPEEAILDVKTAANRPDLLSVIGLAREAAAAAKADLHLPAVKELEGKGKLDTKKASSKVKIEPTTKTRRYLMLEMAVDGSRPSPDWMQRRLIASGLRPINAVVDATNYVMLEYGQPLHAFDADKIKLPLIVRHARGGEKLVTLDGETRKLTAEDIVIADSKHAVALAGVIGGAGSEIGPKTKRVILESASFDAPKVRRTAIRHGVRTESSARFERSLPVQLAPLALARASDLMQRYAGGKVAGLPAGVLTVWPWIQRIGVRVSRVEQMLGFKLSREEIVDLLARFDINSEPFDIVKEAKKHLGKPYVWGASFKTHGAEAFDCSYLTDYIYSLIGKWVGHTAYEQFESGKPVHTGELKPGDILFRNGPWEKLQEAERHGIAHNYLYIGDGKVVHAKQYERDKDGGWVKAAKAQVIIEPVKVATGDPDYKGARRYADDIEDYVSVAEVPWWRPDLRTEEDLIEEIVRAAGYDRVPAKLPAWQPGEVKFDGWWPNVWRTKATLKALGLFEVMTYSFISANDLASFGYDAKKHLKLQNPLSREQAYLRSSLLPSLVAAASKNTSYAKELGLYEVSRVFKSNGKGRLPDEPVMLAVLCAGEAGAYAGVKSALDSLAKEFHLSPKITAAKSPQFHPARYGDIYVGRQAIGGIGEVHPEILAKYRLKAPAAYLEVDLNALFASSKPAAYRPLSKFPSVYRDLAVVVAQKVSWQEIEEALADAPAKVSYLSEFAGKDIPANKKSIAMRLEMSDPAKTLTDAEADERVARIFAKLKDKLRAELRS